MKTLAIALFAMIAAVQLLPAHSASEQDCGLVTSQMTQQTAAFLRIAKFELDAAPTPAKALRNLHYKDTALSETSNRVWDLRARLADMKCPVAETLVY